LNPESILAKMTSSFLAKTQRETGQIFMLSILAGCFIALGAAFMILIKSDANLSFAIMSLLCGLAFSLGLFAILGTGGELFTGNCLIFSVTDYPLDRTSCISLIKYFALVWAGNFIGSLGISLLLFFSGFGELNGGLVGQIAITVAVTKYSLPIGQMFVRSILCNFLVCLAVFVATNASNLMDKFISALLPVSAFVACAFEHCIANQTFFILGGFLSVGAGVEFNIGLAILNLIITTIGNMIGGAVLFAGMFYIAAKKS
jgi:formate/nitrite transporter